MSAGSYNIQIEQGATWRIQFVVSDADGPIDLTGYLLRSDFRAALPDTAVLLTLTSAADPDEDGFAIDADQSGDGKGKFVGLILPATSAAWTWRAGVYDIELVSPGGDVVRLLQGNVTVSPEVTRT